MGVVYFYHLTRQPVDVTLATLIGKARGQGWRILVRGTAQDRLEWLDQKLWLGGDESFLPHGVSGGPYDKDQPVLLTTSAENANEANCVMSIDGASLTAEEINAADRCCILFDGFDEGAVQHARVQWKTLTDAGCAAQYWSEESGSWEKKAEKAAS